jgi:hypothetical protein
MGQKSHKNNGMYVKDGLFASTFLNFALKFLQENLEPISLVYHSIELDELYSIHYSEVSKKDGSMGQKVIRLIRSRDFCQRLE